MTLRLTTTQRPPSVTIDAGTREVRVDVGDRGTLSLGGLWVVTAPAVGRALSLSGRTLSLSGRPLTLST